MFETRMWILTLGVLMLSTLALVGKLIDSAQWVDMLKWIIGLFALGTSGATVIPAVKERIVNGPKSLS